MLHTTLVPIDLESSGEFIFIRYHDFCNMGGERLTLQVEQTIRTLSKEGNSYSVIVKKLKAEGLDVGKATICRVVNGIGKKREAESNGQKFQVDRPRPVRTPATVSKVKRLATTENPPSQRQLSRMCGTSLKTINNIIHKDLELDTRRKGKVHKLTPFHMKNRATNARKLYEEHLAGSRSEYTATLDEAWMYVTYCNGIRKICYIKRGNQVPDNWVHQCSETFPKGFMVVGVMTGRGVLPLIKVPSKVKVNSEFYIECVLKPVIEQLKDLYPGEMDKVFLHHDKASSHTSNKTQQFLQEMKDTLGLNFMRNSDIPVKSPDASPLDFYGFGMLKQRLFNRRPKTEAGLWKAAQEEWSNVSLSKVKEVFAAWKVRCREIAKKKGKHREHMKKIYEDTKDQRVRSHPPQCTTSRADRQIGRMAVTDRSVTSRTVAQHIQSVTCVMLRHTGPAPGIMVWDGIGYHSRTPLVRIAGILHSQRYISEITPPAVTPDQLWQRVEAAWCAVPQEHIQNDHHLWILQVIDTITPLLSAPLFAKCSHHGVGNNHLRQPDIYRLVL
ncbi:IKK1 [Cordylochernes scorpioides]|uniref:IKK1 n=1 Tax=Cordylochernes scorpioides TaxID=51811 RepID=A0ABY6K0F3_9ARAC|nr:IKK1 [Cordylochernes scorpioides]